MDCAYGIRSRIFICRANFLNQLDKNNSNLLIYVSQEVAMANGLIIYTSIIIYCTNDEFKDEIGKTHIPYDPAVGCKKKVKIKYTLI